MATKPATVPRLWATNANWLTGPFIGSPTKADPGVGVAADGHRAGSNFPTAAEHENYQGNRVTDWITNWLFLGTSTTAADAHVVETNAQGRAGLHGLTVADLIDETAVNITGANTLTPTVLATCLTGATVYQSETGNAVGGTGFAGQTKAGASQQAFAAFMTGSPASCRGVRVVADAATAGTGLSVDHAGTGLAGFFNTTGTPSQGAVVRVQSAGPGTTVGVMSSGSMNGAGLQGTGNASASANGVEGFLLNNNGFGLYGLTAPNATAASRGLRAWGRNLADGVEAIVTGAGNALRLVAAANTNVALYVPGKSVDPNDTFNGRLDFNTTTQTWVHSDDDANEYRDFWSSRGGIAVGASEYPSQVVTNNSAVAWATCATLDLVGQDAPHRAGVVVEITFVCDARSVVAATNYVDLVVEDVTAAGPGPNGGALVTARAGVGTSGLAAYHLPVATTAWQRSIVIKTPYVIPAAGPRSFVASVKTATANGIAVRDATLTPFGCMNPP